MISGDDIDYVSAKKTGYLMEEGRIVSNNHAQFVYNIDMTPDVSPSGKGTISGTVLISGSSGNTPVIDAQVILFLRLGGIDNPLDPMDTVTTDANGKFSFTNIDAPAGYTLTAIDGEMIGSINVGLDVDENEDINIFILDKKPSGSGTISGTVTTITGSPEVDAEVILYLHRGGIGDILDSMDVTLTDTDGKFSFTDVDAPNSYTIKVIVDGEIVGSESVGLNDYEDEVVDFTIEIPTNTFKNIKNGSISFSEKVSGDRILFNFTNTFENARLNMYTSLGKMIFSSKIGKGTQTLTIPKGNGSGVLLVKLFNKSHSEQYLMMIP
jgi:hypothetical protein